MAAQDLDALLAEVPDEETPETPEAAGTESEQAAAAAALKLAEMDAVIPPDAADVDEAFRGKPLSEVLRIAAQHQHEIGVARSKSQQFNALESRARVAEGALEWLQREIAERGQPQQAPQPPETEQDLLDRLAARPGAVIHEKVTEQVDPLREEVQMLLERNVRLAADFAREQARTALGIDPETWEAITPQLAAVTASRQWNIEDARAWYAAGQEYVSHLRRFMPPQAPAAPPIEVPKPAAPPSGGARSTSRPSAPVKLRGRDDENANDIMSAFGIAPDSARAADFKTFIATRAKGVE